MTTINKGANKFYVGENIQNPLAEITFVESGKARLVIDHTYVSSDLRGQGVAGQLVDNVVQYAREEGKKILPLCPYAKDKIEKNEDYHDVLSKY